MDFKFHLNDRFNDFSKLIKKAYFLYISNILNELNLRRQGILLHIFKVQDKVEAIITINDLWEIDLEILFLSHFWLSLIFYNLWGCIALWCYSVFVAHLKHLKETLFSSLKVRKWMDMLSSRIPFLYFGCMWRIHA